MVMLVITKSPLNSIKTILNSFVKRTNLYYIREGGKEVPNSKLKALKRDG